MRKTYCLAGVMFAVTAEGWRMGAFNELLSLPLTSCRP